MGIKDISHQTNCAFTFIMRKVLHLFVRSLNDDPGNGSLYSIGAIREPSEVECPSHVFPITANAEQGRGVVDKGWVYNISRLR